MTCSRQETSSLFMLRWNVVSFTSLILWFM